MDARYIVLLVFLVLLVWNLYLLFRNVSKEPFTNTNSDLEEYIQRFNDKEHRMFPFRYFTDENDKVLPIVAVTGFFRGKDAEDRFREYKQKGVLIFGITAYKSFPNRDMMDESEGEYERNDTFEFTKEIRDWLCCFKDKTTYGFSSWNRTIDISESDFYTAEKDQDIKKKWDFIYICNKFHI